MTKKAKKTSPRKKTGSLDRVFHVMRFTEEDKTTLYEYLRCYGSRHEALLALVPIVEQMADEFKKGEGPKDHAVRLGLPQAFINAAKELDRPMTKTIIQAAKRAIRKKGEMTDAAPLRQSEEMEK